MIDKNYEDYKDFDMSGATRGVHPLILAKQKQNEQTDHDVLQVTLNIREDIAKEFTRRAKQLGKSQQALMQEAMAEYLTTH